MEDKNKKDLIKVDTKKQDSKDSSVIEKKK